MSQLVCEGENRQRQAVCPGTSEYRQVYLSLGSPNKLQSPYPNIPSRHDPVLQRSKTLTDDLSPDDVLSKRRLCAVQAPRIVKAMAGYFQGQNSLQAFLNAKHVQQSIAVKHWQVLCLPTPCTPEPSFLQQQLWCTRMQRIPFCSSLASAKR